MVNTDVFRIRDDQAYASWIEEFDEIRDDQIKSIKCRVESLSSTLRIAVVPLAANASSGELIQFKRMLESQIYPRWHICFQDNIDLDDASLVPCNAGSLAALISQAALTADFVLPLPLDAILPPQALAHFVLTLSEIPDADIIYADEDVLRGKIRSQPSFKTDWDPLLILGSNFVGIPALYRAQAIQRAQPEELCEKARATDNLLHALTLRVSSTSSSERILHIPSILAHRSKLPEWSGDQARHIVSSHLASLGLGTIEVCPAPLDSKWNRISFPLPTPAPSVSIIVPTRDRADLISACVTGILYRTDYPSFELIIVDNGTKAPDALAIIESFKSDNRVRVLRDDRPFNYSRLNNYAVTTARGDILVLLNNDVEILHDDWLTELVSLASYPGIGVAGAKLVYPDLRIQHAGVTFGPDSTIQHQMRLASRNDPGPGGALTLIRSVSAVTGACLATHREIYIKVGGLNEERLRVAYSDIDLCRKVARLGLSIVWTPFVELVHHESISRGQVSTPEKAGRDSAERIAFWSMNRDLYEFPDPFHNPQIHFQNDCVDFARPPRPHRFRRLRNQERYVAFLY